MQLSRFVNTSVGPIYTDGNDYPATSRHKINYIGTILFSRKFLKNA